MLKDAPIHNPDINIFVPLHCLSEGGGTAWNTPRRAPKGQNACLERHRESCGSLLFIKHPNPRQMKIKMLNKHGRNAVQGELVNALLHAKKPVRIDKLFVSFEVDEWHTFLSLLWMAYAAASRQSDGEAMRSRYRVSIIMEDGRMFHTDVWFDGSSIRYVSLSDYVRLY